MINIFNQQIGVEMQPLNDDTNKTCNSLALQMTRFN